VKDIQNSYDSRKIAIDKVGIKDIRLPITVKDRRQGTQNTVAEINFYVDLPSHFKGTHMSRFVEILNQYRKSFDIHRLEDILTTARRKLHALKAHLELTFPYFIEKRAPVTESAGMLDYLCTISAAGNGKSRDNSKVDLVLTVRVPITTLCPCSKEISKYGAHSQRSIVTLSVRPNENIWLEELIDMVEQNASAQIYSLLKRPDEKFVTETAYENPNFVEDIVRGVTETVAKDGRIDWFEVSSENWESIHNHNAYASIERNLKAEREEQNLIESRGKSSGKATLVRTGEAD